MKKALTAMMAVFIPLSCSILTTPLTIKDVVTTKEKIETSINPAARFILNEKLKDETIRLDNIIVKDIIESTNIDYDFCIISDIQSDKGPVECFIYTKNVYKISRLTKGKSKIHVTGIFSRFFTLPDQYFTKVDIIKADIDVVEEKK